MANCKITETALLIVLIVFNVSCSHDNKQIDAVENDTMRVVKIGLREAISLRYMPDASALKPEYSSSDSILLTSSLLPLSSLPTKIDSQTFKVLPKETMCQFGIDTSAVNYLDIVSFESTDTSFDIHILNLSCIKFGGGGSLLLTLKKVGDSILVTKRSSSSIN